MQTTYPPLLEEFLTRGEPRFGNNWMQILESGLGAEHVPELIRMATDEALHKCPMDDPTVYAPIHAWRALGQLVADEATEPLLGLLWRIDVEDDDWLNEDIPIVLGMVGPTALPATTAYLHDRGRFLYARSAAATAIRQIGIRHPESRPQCVAVLAEQLERFDVEDAGLNAFVIAELVDLRAAETAPLIQRAFESDAVDLSVNGGWPRVEYDLGLTDQPPEDRIVSAELPTRMAGDFTNYAMSISAEARSELARRRNAERKAAARAKKQAKQQKKQRKQQRKH